MGSLISSIFGGSQSKNTSTNSSASTTENQAFPFLMEKYGGGAPSTNESFGAINSLLGGDRSGLDSYKKVAGYDQAAVNAGRGVAATGAASGLLNSGATGKAYAGAQSALDNQYAGQYLDRLFQKAGLGLNVGQLLSGAGGKSYSASQGTGQGSSSNNEGILGGLGTVASMFAMSDRRLKEDIVHVDTLHDGLKVYQFKYKGSDDGIQVGVMADEVAELRPDALGPVIDGYASVNYDKIWSQ